MPRGAVTGGIMRKWSRLIRIVGLVALVMLSLVGCDLLSRVFGGGVPIESVSINDDGGNLIVGDTRALELEVVYEDGLVFPLTEEATWESSDSAVMTVNAGSLVATAPGDVTITASYEGLSDTVDFAVFEYVEPDRVEVSPSSVLLLVGETAQLTLNAIKDDEIILDATETVLTTWTSFDVGVVSVTDSGLVTALATGRGSINGRYLEPTISANATATIDVVPPGPSGLGSGSVTPDSVELTWTDNTPNEDEFAIERSTGGGAFTEIGTASANAVSFTDSTVSASTSYSYRIRAKLPGEVLYYTFYSNTLAVNTPAASLDFTVSGTVKDSISGAAIQGADVQIGSTVVTTNASGAFSFLQVGGAPITGDFAVHKDTSYSFLLVQDATFDTDISLDLRLTPNAGAGVGSTISGTLPIPADTSNEQLEMLVFTPSGGRSYYSSQSVGADGAYSIETGVTASNAFVFFNYDDGGGGGFVRYYTNVNLLSDVTINPVAPTTSTVTVTNPNGTAGEAYGDLVVPGYGTVKRAFSGSVGGSTSAGISVANPSNYGIVWHYVSVTDNSPATGDTTARVASIAESTSSSVTLGSTAGLSALGSGVDLTSASYGSGTVSFPTVAGVDTYITYLADDNGYFGAVFSDSSSVTLPAALRTDVLDVGTNWDIGVTAVSGLDPSDYLEFYTDELAAFWLLFTLFGSPAGPFAESHFVAPTGSAAYVFTIDAASGAIDLIP